jgi:endonuclease YncB( thermonuclease family)
LVAVALALPVVAGAETPLFITGKVISVHDGDTISVLENEHAQYRIRLAGIDAPEKGQAFGNVAREHLASLCAGRLVKASCSKIDRYGRHVCTVWVDEMDVSLAQLRAGLAWHFKRYASEQSPDERAAYARAEEESRAAGLGLWQDKTPVPPWQWRALSMPAAGSGLMLR